MSVKDQLTNEKVSKRFDNPFALVNYAIKLAKQRIAQGDIGESNLSTEILDAIADGRDYIEEFADDEIEGEIDLNVIVSNIAVELAERS